MADKPNEKPALKTLAPNRLQLAEYKRNVHRIMVDVDVTLADLLAPTFWTHAAKQLRNNDKIEVIAADGKFYAELLVVSARQVEAIVKAINYTELTEAEVKETKKEKAKPKFVVEYKGTDNQHCVIRVADKNVLKSGFNSKPEAEEWLGQYELGLAE